ncbi:hypothetical protein [Novipirellula galeiformis]|uniref:hypothetical protein n=1 Tax=Novipirellula galeiformis TaxID=2528004 RepID=UPI0018CDFDE2|nr:hypothetical protein [Novipirellula galeiformis]
MFEYPLSYLVNSQTFTDLHPALQTLIAAAIWDSFPPEHEFHAILIEVGPDWQSRRHSS